MSRLVVGLCTERSGPGTVTTGHGHRARLVCIIGIIKVSLGENCSQQAFIITALSRLSFINI